MKIQVVSFETEAKYDKLTVNGQAYSGNKGPVDIVASGTITWTADYSVNKFGWKICPWATPAPPAPPPNTEAPTELPTDAPTAAPTLTPTAMPTPMPTPVPTSMPTAVPTLTPTGVPTPMPTEAPTTAMPTAAPTGSPTEPYPVEELFNELDADRDGLLHLEEFKGIAEKFDLDGRLTVF